MQDFNKGMETAKSDDYNIALTEWIPLVEAGDADAGYLSIFVFFPWNQIVEI